MSDTSDIYKLLSFVANTTIYFLPVLIAYSCSKKFNANVLVSIILACALIHPSLIAIVGEGKAFTVFGIPMTLVNY